VKIYRIEYTGGVLGVIALVFGCLTIVLLPLAIVFLPTMYRIVEDDE